MDKTWYLGPLGKLRGLVCPEPGMTDTSTRYGGVHQGLTGARTMDITGHRREFEFEFTYLEKSEFEWLNALHTRMVPGPLYLLDPRYRNRLSPQATSLRSTYNAANLGLQVSMGVARDLTRDFPDDIPYGTHSLAATSFVENQTITTDAGALTPVRQGETITGSWYARAVGEDPSQVVSLSFEWFDADRASQGVSAPQEVTLGSEWNRYSYTATVPEGVSAVVMRLTFGTYNAAVRLAAPMIEEGGTATEWEQGKAVAMVLVDQLQTSSPLFPLTDCSLTLLEA